MQKSLQKRIYQDLCAVLSLQGAVDWGAYRPDEWPAFVDRAQREGVAALVYALLRTDRLPDGLPAEVVLQLAGEYYQASANNALIYQELGRILDAFQLAVVDVLLLKGAVLARELYPDPARRPMGDIDLLVPASQLERAVQTVQELGYALDGMLLGLPADLQRLLNYEVNFNGGELVPFHLELHWGLIAACGRPRSPDINWFWEMREPFTDFHPQAGQLSASAHLLYLAAHLMIKHAGKNEDRLIWYYDLHLFLTRWADRLDWKLILAQARAFDWDQGLLLALQGVHMRFSTPLPPPVWEVFQAEAELLHAKPQLAGATRWGSIADDLKTLSVLNRLRLVFYLIFPRPGYLRQLYNPQPAYLWPLYYLVRWAGFVEEGWGLVTRRWLHRVTSR